MKLNRFATFAWANLGYNLLVILWGAYVRATGSGAGCGAHWPLCNGQVVPRAEQVATLIEFTHRITSGIALILTVVLLVWAFRAYPKGHAVRTGARLSMFFMITEALVGAGLVLFKLVAHNDSEYRAVSIAIHQVNTLLLLGALTLTAWWASGGARLQLRGRGAFGWTFGIGLGGLLLLGATGAITALGDTLFPIEVGSNGISRSLDDTAHFLERLRVIHPGVAIAMGVYITGLAWWLNRRATEPAVERLTWVLTGLFLAQLLVGAMNVALYAPVWMQLVHLLMADLVWIAFVLLAATTLAVPLTTAERPQTRQAQTAGP